MPSEIVMAPLSRFAPQDRVTLSALGRERSPRIKACAGTIQKVLGTHCDVLFDGNRTITTLHETYLEALQDEQQERLARFERRFD